MKVYDISTNKLSFLSWPMSRSAAENPYFWIIVSFLNLDYNYSSLLDSKAYSKTHSTERLKDMVWKCF